MSDSTFFIYGETEINYLKAKDPILGAVIDEIGHVNRPVTPDLFSALINSIVGQQISNKALATVWARMEERFFPMNEKTLQNATLEELQSCGISFRKAAYIRDVAEAVQQGTLDLKRLHKLSDAEVSRELTKIKGIGAWTAEMLMIFSMQRPNILSIDDLAILRGLRMLYRHRAITPKLFAKYKRRYSPYATVAGLYLWAIAGGACPALLDPAASSKGNVKKKKSASKK